MREGSSTDGLYGKIPGYGDYVLRRLPSQFVEPWNGWISAALARSQVLLAEGFLHAYLTSAPWRFLIEPGILGPMGWIGVMASSVDRVGRCYPLVVAMSLGQEMRLHWLGDEVGLLAARLERLALDLIDGSLGPDDALARIDDAGPLAARCGAPVPLLGRGGAERVMVGSVPAPVSGLALRWFSEAGEAAGEPLSGWWHGGWNGAPPASLMTTGLPAPDTFASFLDGAWTERGWTEQFGDGRSA